jgi:predicted acyl esterase
MIYAADAIHEWVFTLEPLSVVLAVGERLRLEIASSAFPLYDRNPSTAIDPQHASEWTWSRSTQLVFHTAQYPSELQLPVTGDAGW